MLKSEFEELLLKRLGDKLPALHVTLIKDYNGKQYGILSDSSGKIDVYRILKPYAIKPLKSKRLHEQIVKDMLRKNE